MMTPDHLYLAALMAFVIAAGLTPLVRDIALRRSWLDEPNHRSSHLSPIPRVGGAAFIVATMVGVVIGTGSFEWWMPGIGLGALLVAAGGLMDDLARLSVAPKFAAQIGAALIAVALLEPRILVDLPFWTATFSPVVSAVLAIFWIVSVVNAFNFLDGADGLAAGVALVVALAIAGMLAGSVSLLLPFAAALAGFLLWNSAPASIFMGDLGSQFVGYVLATSVIIPGPTDTGAVPMLFVFAVVLGDALVTILRRMTRGASPFAADRNHVFHYLIDAGASHRAVAVRYMMLTAIGGMAGLAYLHAGSLIRAILLFGVIVPMCLIIVRLVRLPAPRSLMQGSAMPMRPSGSKLTNG
jgi:UDP-GlcNAc:undecaprenyl-phosphate GlcNAc-1-phosphate transferase